ncbi:LacI family DNA-binding transcriptional regulator [Nonomuraea sp. MTCD27]|uniref:LacI family DNA-binding transcriptional regulator n=1 Tax=Nonomuraea sp. MTCD27 TaxID=1676747 RepID=UPI0035BEFF33
MVARRLTQQDIARMAGVSQTTVSLVLSNRVDSAVRISPKTRQRVLRVIRETGYIADPAARRLAEEAGYDLLLFTSARATRGKRRIFNDDSQGLLIPRGHDRAAVPDVQQGLGHFGTFYRVALPPARPALGAPAIFAFLHSWNLHLEPIVCLSSPTCSRSRRRSPSSSTPTAGPCGTSSSPPPP